MTSITRVLSVAFATVVLAAAGVGAQGAGRSSERQAGQPAAEPAQLKVQIAVSRSKPGAETTTLPFELMIRADGRSATTLAVGVDVPVPAGTAGSYQYRRVGNNITCMNASYSNGTITLEMTIEDSSIHTDGARESGGEPVLITSSEGQVTLRQAERLVQADRISLEPVHAPMFRSFQTTTQLSMREGETVQFTLATDKQTGETLKVSVSASRVH